MQTLPVATDTAAFIALTAAELASCHCPASALRDFLPAELYPELEAAVNTLIPTFRPAPRHYSAAERLLSAHTDAGVTAILEAAQR